MNSAASSAIKTSDPCETRKEKKKQKTSNAAMKSLYLVFGDGFGGFIMMSTDISYPGDKGKGLEDRGGTGIRSRRFRQ